MEWAPDRITALRTDRPTWVFTDLGPHSRQQRVGTLDIARLRTREAPDGNRITCGRDGRRPDLSPGRGGGQIVHAPPDAVTLKRNAVVPPRRLRPNESLLHILEHTLRIAPVGRPEATATASDGQGW